MFLCKKGRPKILAILLAILLLLGGCTSKVSTSPSEISEKIIETTSFSKLSSLSGDKLSSHFGFTDAHVHRFNVLISSSGESADTVAVFEARSNDQKTTVVTGVSGYLTKLSSSFKNTIGSEYNKVESRLLLELDDIIILVICSDTEAVKNLLTKMGAKDLY